MSKNANSPFAVHIISTKKQINSSETSVVYRYHGHILGVGRWVQRGVQLPSSGYNSKDMNCEKAETLSSAEGHNINNCEHLHNKDKKYT